MSTTTHDMTLAIDGGAPALPNGITVRRLFDHREKEAVLALFDRAIDQGAGLLGYNGKQEQAYCAAFCEMLGGGYADGVNSGTNAVYVALAALEPEPGSEVIVPPVTDPGGMMPVAMLGCAPIVADAAPEYYNMGAEQIAAVLSERTAAIIVAHIGGIACDMEPILTLAREHQIPVLEDCAQAHLTRYCGQPVGTLGDISAFSTMFGKQHASAGQGGIVYTRDEALHAKARRYADRGKPIGLPAGTKNVAASLNFNMDELHATVGRVNLEKLPGHIRRRQQIATAMAAHCHDHLDGVRMIEPRQGDEGSFWFLTFTLDCDKFRVNRDKFAEALAAEGVPASGGYVLPGDWPWLANQCPVCWRPRPCGRSGCAGNAPFVPVALPNARTADQKLVRVNIHEDWSDQDIMGVCQALSKVALAYHV